MAATYYTLTIIASPSNATVRMNGEVTNRLSVTKGTVVDWTVSCSGYVSQSGSETVDSNKTLPVTLEAEYCTFTIDPTPSDAIVIINGDYTNSVEVVAGSTVVWSVSKEGYQTKSGSTTVNSTITKPVPLEKGYWTFTINPDPSDAIVTIDGKRTNSIEVETGSTVEWSVSKDGYRTQNGSTTVTSTTTLPVVLKEIHWIVTINPTPSDAIVIINGVTTNSIETTIGSTVEWSVSKNGYRTQSGSMVVTQNHIFDVILTVVVKKDVFLGNFVCPEIYLGDQSISAIYAGPTLVWGVPVEEDVPTDVRSVVVGGTTTPFPFEVLVGDKTIYVYLYSGTYNIGANLYNVHISNTLSYVDNTIRYDSSTGEVSFDICGSSPSTNVSATIYWEG